jgi:hypothetical protein
LNSTALELHLFNRHLKTLPLPLTENFRFYVCIRFLIEPMGRVAQGLRAFNAEDSCHHGVRCASLWFGLITNLYRTYARRAGARARAARAADVPSEQPALH